VKVIWTSLEATDLKLEFRRNNKAEKAESVEFGNVTRFGDAEALIIGKPGQYNVYLNGSEIAEYDFKQGANYNLLLRGKQIVIHQLTPESSISMFWQLPQYLIMTMGEILFSISTMEFCYTQAPLSMKAVTLALRYLTNAVGNAIDIVVMSAFEGVLPKQAYEFFFFSGLTILSLLVFLWMSMSYK